VWYNQKMTFKPSAPEKKQGSPKSFRLSSDLITDLEKMAKAHDIKLNRLVSQALQHVVDEWRKTRKRK